MNILVDTNVFIWFAEDNKMINSGIKTVLENEKNNLFVSVVTFWEIAIKKSIKKLEMQLTLNELYWLTVKEGFNILPIKFEHIAFLENLPYYHKDPFDRLIISQAFEEELVVATIDKVFIDYGINVIS